MGKKDTANIFKGFEDYIRMIQHTETDHGGPVPEETMSQIRENIEALFQLTYSTGVSGTLTADPTDASDSQVTDSAAAFGTDTHNNRTFMFLSGDAQGNMYTIDDTDSGTTMTFNGDNLYSDGGRSGDAYEIFFDIKNNLDGHDHDGDNSKNVVLADATITTAKLSTTEIDADVDRTSIGATVTYHEFVTSQYCFGMTTKHNTSTYVIDAEVLEYDLEDGFSNPTTEYTRAKTNFNVQAAGGQKTFQIRVRYVTASGDIYWLFILREVKTKESRRKWGAMDHPCYGHGKPLLTPHPFQSDVEERDGKLYLKHSYDGDGNLETDIEVEILCINIEKEVIQKVRSKMEVDDEEKNDLTFLEALFQNYEIDDTIEPDWITTPVNVALPKDKDWRREPDGTLVEPIRKIIPKPDMVRTAGLKKKEVK